MSSVHGWNPTGASVPDWASRRVCIPEVIRKINKPKIRQHLWRPPLNRIPNTYTQCMKNVNPVFGKTSQQMHRNIFRSGFTWFAGWKKMVFQRTNELIFTGFKELLYSYPTTWFLSFKSTGKLPWSGSCGCVIRGLIPNNCHLSQLGLGVKDFTACLTGSGLLNLQSERYRSNQDPFSHGSSHGHGGALGAIEVLRRRADFSGLASRRTGTSRRNDSEWACPILLMDWS